MSEERELSVEMTETELILVQNQYQVRIPRTEDALKSWAAVMMLASNEGQREAFKKDFGVEPVPVVSGMVLDTLNPDVEPSG